MHSSARQFLSFIHGNSCFYIYAELHVIATEALIQQRNVGGLFLSPAPDVVAHGHNSRSNWKSTQSELTEPTLNPQLESRNAAFLNSGFGNSGLVFWLRVCWSSFLWGGPLMAPAASTSETGRGGVTWPHKQLYILEQWSSTRGQRPPGGPRSYFRGLSNLKRNKGNFNQNYLWKLKLYLYIYMIAKTPLTGNDYLFSTI